MTPDFSSKLLNALCSAHRVVAFTGAGISAESGVPTFRGTDGIWKQMKPEELANLNAFMKNPELVWEWYAHRKRIIATMQPNAGHHALVRLESIVPDFALITQNIDNLHRRAGSKNVFELHGNIERNYCITCGTPYTNEAVLSKPGVPRCDRCDGLIRPDVVWFGEMLPEEEWAGAERAAASADVLLSIGTSAVVYPAASLPLTAKRNGAFVVEINPEETSLTHIVDEFLRGMSGTVLPGLVAEIARGQASRRSRLP